MKYLLLVSHGTMAPGVHSVIKMLLGDRDNVLSYSMEDGVSADDFVVGLSNVLEPVGADDSLVVLGDIVGGSPLTNALNTITQKGLLARTIDRKSVVRRSLTADGNCRAHGHRGRP